MKLKFMSVVGLLCFVVVGSVSGGLHLDPLLVKHSLYAKAWIYGSNASQTPKGGTVGTPGYINAGGNLLNVYTDVYTGNTRGNNINVQAGATFNYVNKTGTVIDKGGTINVVAEVYPTLPKFPDLPAESNYSSGAQPAPDTTITPGAHGKLVNNCTLKAGTYYFRSIELESAKNILIDDNGDDDYRTIIYVRDRITLKSGASIGPNSDDGLGQVIIIYGGGTMVNLVSPSTVKATVIAPSAQVRFNSNSKLFGQVFANTIYLQDFKNSAFVFTPYLQTGAEIPNKVFNEDNLNDPIANNSHEIKIPVNLEFAASDSAAKVGWAIVVNSSSNNAGTTLANNNDIWPSSGGKVMTDTVSSGIMTFPVNTKITSDTPSVWINDDKIFESDETFQLRLKANTTNVDLDDDTVSIITIKSEDPENLPPTRITFLTKSINEELDVGTVVGSLTTEDPNATDTHTYSIIGGDAKFDISGSNLITNYKFDYELEARSYDIKIRTSDGEIGGTLDSVFTIKIDPINDSTNVTRDSTYAVLENASLTNNLLPIPTDGDEIQANNRFKFVIVDSPVNSSVFNLDPSTGYFNYTPNSAGNEFASDKFSYVVVDSATYDLTTKFTGNKSWAYINITNVNDEPPVGTDFTINDIYENDIKTIYVNSRITDADTRDGFIDNFTVTFVSDPSAGTATIDGKKVIYKHDGTTEIFTDQIKYKVTDLNGNVSVEKTITVNIKPINDNKAVANDYIYGTSIKKGDPKKLITVGEIIGNDADADLHTTLTDGNMGSGNVATLTSKFYGGDGDVVTTAAGFEYTSLTTPGVLTDEFEYWISDGITYIGNGSDNHNQASSAKVIINLLPNFSLNSPTAQEAFLSVIEEVGSSDAIDLKTITNDLDIADGDVLTYSDDHNDSIADVDIVNGVLTYTYKGADPVEVFTETFNYTVKDIENNSATQTISVTIGKLNDNIPTQKDTTVGVVYGKYNTIQLPTPIDVDLPAQSISIDTTIPNNGITVSALHGDIIKLSGNSYGYKPDISKSIETDEFTYQLLDSTNYDTQAYRITSKVLINIDNSSRALPVAVDDRATLDEGGTLNNIVVMGNDLRSTTLNPLDGPSLISISVDLTGVHHGTLTQNGDGTCNYVHDNSENFLDIYNYTVTDGIETGSGTITITINPLNDNSPQDDTLRLFEVEEGKSGSYDVGVNLFDLPQEDVSTVWDVSLSGVNGGATLASSVTLTGGILTYYHDGDGPEFPLEDTVRLTVRDVTTYTLPGSSDKYHEVERILVVTINPVNDNTPEITGAPLEFIVDEGDTLNITDSSGISGGILKNATDADGDSLWVTLVSSPALAEVNSFKINPNGTFFYAHTGVEEFTDHFVVKVRDGTFDTTITISITINPKNDEAAVTSEDAYNVDESQTLTVNLLTGLLANDIDSDLHPTETPDNGNILRVVLSATTKFGDLTLNSDGSFVYVNAGQGREEVADTFSYHIIDSTTYDNGVTHTSAVPTVVIITINNTLDELPIATDDAIHCNEGESVDILTTGARSVLLNDSDPDGVALTAILIESVVHGTLTLSSDGTFVYTHNGSENYSDSFTYWAHDETDSTMATVSITISPKPPVVIKDGANYWDLNADGMVDQITLEFNHTVDTANIVFTATWGVDSLNIPVTGVALDSTAKVVTLSLGRSLQDRTSGLMSIMVDALKFENGATQYPVADRAAPVISFASYQISNGLAELSVYHSEVISGISTSPYRFISKGVDKTFEIGVAASSGNLSTYSFDKSIYIAGDGDSICINQAGDVADGLLNIQKNPANVRKPIRLNNSVVSVSYLDTNEFADGYIDLISVETAIPLDSTFDEALKVAKFKLSASRGFIFDRANIVRSAIGFDIFVIEKRGEVRTSLDSLDLFSLDSAVSSSVGNWSVAKSETPIKITDRVAPVITAATFSFTEEGVAEQLIVEFSEPVEIGGVNPYNFYDNSTGEMFTMELSLPEIVGPTQVKYSVISKSIEYVVGGDSIAIELSGVMADTLLNNQGKTVRAKISVTSKYNSMLELFVYPQPMTLLPKGDSYEAEPLEESLMNHFNFSAAQRSVGRGVAFILKASGPLAAAEKQFGEFKILDNLGNPITEFVPMDFDIDSEGSITGVAVWGGQNKRGRTVGRSAYFAVLRVRVVLDDGENTVIRKEFTRMVGVRY
jgi:VCBS repeat-containing protein